MSSLKTVIAESNEIFRHGLSSILSETGCFDICSAVDNGALVLTAYENVEPHLCILSFNMPEVDGLIIAKKILTINPTANLLMMAEDSSEKVLNDFLDSGADGLLLKSAHKIELIEAAHSVAKGERYLGKQFARMMTREYRRLQMEKKTPDYRKKITKRESEIMYYLAQGYTSAEIAKKLFISPRTVDTHRNNLLKKLKLKNTAALVRFAIENNHLEETG